MFGGSMSMSFHTLNFPVKFLGKTQKHGMYRCSRVIPTLAAPSSSVHMQISVPNMSSPNKDASSGSILNQVNAIGIIGGASSDCTLNFLHKLVQWGSNDGKYCPPFLLCSEPQLKEDLLIYERSYLPSIYTRGQPSRVDHDRIISNVRSKREFLEKGGARCVVIPCHLLHSWYEEISSGCSVPVFHVGECVARELKEAELRPLEAGSPLRIGLVATEAVLKAGFYQEKLQNEGFEVVLPDKATMEHIILPAIEALDRKDIEGARNLLRIALQVLLVRAVNTVIIASHGMHELLPEDDPLLKKCIDPLDALVRSTMTWAHSVEGTAKQ